MMVLDLKRFSVEAKSFKEEGLFSPEFDRSELAKHKEAMARMSKQYETRKLAE